MNWIIFLGIGLVALGTVIATWGGAIQRKRDGAQSSAKMTEIVRDLAELKGKPKSALSESALSRVEGEIKEWARNFESDKEQKRSLLQQRLNEEVDYRTHSADLVRGYFTYMVSFIKESLVRYPTPPATANTVIPEIPADLFFNPSSRFEADIPFSKVLRWKIVGMHQEQAPALAPVTILIYLIEAGQTGGGDRKRAELMLMFYKDAQRFSLRLLGRFHEVAPSGDFNGSTTEYEDRIRSVMRALIEAQLLQN